MSELMIIPPKNSGSTRTDAEHAAIYKFYILDGQSAKQAAATISAMFPDRPVSRNVIVTYAARQGWDKAGRAGGQMAGTKTTKALPAGKARGVGPAAAVLADLDPIVGSRIVNGQAVDIHMRSCRWPVGKPAPRGAMHLQLFCGEQAEPGCPYCPPHSEVAYPTAALQKRRADHAATNSGR